MKPRHQNVQQDGALSGAHWRHPVAGCQSGWARRGRRGTHPSFGRSCLLDSKPHHRWPARGCPCPRASYGSERIL